MTDQMMFTIGSRVVCNDGEDAGKVARVIVDPVHCAVTHLAVDPPKGHVGGRLVPIELVSSAEAEVHLGCSHGEYHALDESVETSVVEEFPPLGGSREPMAGMGLPSSGVSSFGVGGGAPIGSPIFDDGVGERSVVSREKVPPGEVQVRKGDRVHATDGAIGRVRGVVVDAHDHVVGHILLDEGHLFSKKHVAIPIADVSSVEEDGAYLSLTKSEIEALDPVDLDHLAT